MFAEYRNKEQIKVWNHLKRDAKKVNGQEPHLSHQHPSPSNVCLRARGSDGWQREPLGLSWTTISQKQDSLEKHVELSMGPDLHALGLSPFCLPRQGVQGTLSTPANALHGIQKEAGWGHFMT